VGDKDAIKLLQEKIRATVRRQARVKEAAASTVMEKEERERQERP